MSKLAAVGLLLALGGVAFVGCKSQDGARKGDPSTGGDPFAVRPSTSPDAATGQKRTWVDGDAAPTPDEERAAEVAGHAQCVSACVEQNQMRAEAPESIRAGCEQSCTETCMTACIGANDQDEGVAAACKQRCTP